MFVFFFIFISFRYYVSPFLFGNDPVDDDCWAFIQAVSLVKTVRDQIGKFFLSL